MYRCVALLLLVCGASHAAMLFEDETILDITLAGPLSSVIDDTTEQRQRAFVLSADGKDIDVAVRIRGKSRVELCDFPPLRLNFSAGAARGSVFDGEDKLKLVTHCKAAASYEKNAVQEYGVYRIMNVLSDLSLRARLLRIRYVDTESPDQEPAIHYGFLIESDASLAARLGASVVELRDVSKAMFNRQHLALVFVFQYLVGNTDWSLVRADKDDSCCHNGKLVRVAEQHYFLPYDFDMTGFVRARYAKPNPRLRLTSVRTRRYRGYCLDEATVRDALHAVKAHREAILKVVAGLPLLSAKEIKSDSAYLQRFFDRAANEDKLLREFGRRCLR
ncbi:MAG: hypothetical protein HKN64_05875 [Woeseiaceae bacterium]|nr:hypothetical protein [Woeseiaceae bacterium]